MTVPEIPPPITTPPTDAARGRSAPGGPDARWWRVPTMWLVVGGPLAVVVASVATATIAHRGADRVVVEVAAPGAGPVRPDSRTPALQARNHAATARPATIPGASADGGPAR